MSTFNTTTLPTRRAPRVPIGAIIASIGAIVAIGLAALFLSLGGTNQAKPTAHSHHTSAYVPLIQYHGTGAPPASATTRSPSVPNPATQRKSYGAVP
jgi:hypothetical protein